MAGAASALVLALVDKHNLIMVRLLMIFCSSAVLIIMKYN